MPRRIGLSLAVVLALSGCGGGGDSSDQSDVPAQTPPASPQGKAVDDFARAAQAFWDDFRNCGSRAYPTRNFYSACTRRTRRDFHDAEDLVLRALDRSKNAACKHPRDRLGAVMAHVGGAVESTVVAFDRTNNASLKNRPYSGPSPRQLFPRGQQAIEEDLPAARRLSREIDAGCRGSKDS